MSRIFQVVGVFLLGMITRLSHTKNQNGSLFFFFFSTKGLEMEVIKEPMRNRRTKFSLLFHHRFEAIESF